MDFDTAVDEPAEDGCAQCAVKHLSAALSVLTDVGGDGAACPDDVSVLAARAFINVVEAVEGYSSHSHIAIGLVQRAEELAVLRGDAVRARRLRSIRCAMMGLKHAAEWLPKLRAESEGGFAKAHVAEALREFAPIRHEPVDSVVRTGLVHRVCDIISFIENNFYAHDDARPDNPEEGGESEMATKKAAKKPQVAKSAGKVKAVQACGKGGKCKK